MKKLTVFVAALVLTLGLAQCKKEQTNTANDAQGVQITLNVGGGASTGSAADGSRVIVDPDGHHDPDYATVAFEDGDVIYVGNNGAYCGYLEYDGAASQFSGTVNPTNEADYLHFYFMGNKGENAEPTSVSITDQTGKYPVISYAHSTALYNSGTTSYSAFLLNKCAIVKFSTTDLPTTTAITITGMNNTVTVDFAANNAAASTTGEPYAFGKAGEGEITLHAESSAERWAILLPQGEVTAATASADGYATESAFTVPAIAANDYYTNNGEGIGVELVATAPEHDYVDLGLPSGLLWATCNVGADTPEGYGDYFAWGETQTKDTYDKSNYQYYYPITFQLTKYCNMANDGYNGFIDNLTTLESEDDAATANWGNGWRMPTQEEFKELLDNTTVTWTTQNGVNGRLFTATNGNSLFLPAAGYYKESNLNKVGNQGRYWSSTLYTENNYYAWILYFNNSVCYKNSDYRYYGLSVRAVRDVQ